MFCPTCGSRLPENAVFCAKCGAQVQMTAQAVQSASVAAQSTPTPSPKRRPSGKLIGAAVAAITVVAVVAAGFATNWFGIAGGSGGANSDSPAGPTLFEIGELYAMRPDELADYLESHGMKYVTADDVAESQVASVGFRANTWWSAGVLDGFADGWSPQNSTSSLAIAAEAAEHYRQYTVDGYLVNAAAYDERYKGWLQDSLAGNDHGTLYDLMLSDQQLRAASSVCSLNMTFLDFEGFYLSRMGHETTLEEAREMLGDVLQKSALGAPAEEAAWRYANYGNSSSGIGVAQCIGFCAVNGEECVYCAAAGNEPYVILSIQTLQDAYEEYGVNSKDSLIAALDDSYDNPSNKGSFERVS